MLFVYTGTDISKIAQASNALIAGLRKKQPEAELITLNQVSEEILRSLSNDQGLFFQKSLVRIEKILPDSDQEEIIKNNLECLVNSPSVFVWSESELNKTWVKRLEKSGATIKQFGEKAQAGFDKGAFGVANALVDKDSKKLWQEIVKVKNQGGEAEGIFGMLWWQIKVILLAKQFDQKATDLKPFVYNKAKRSSWKVSQAKQILDRLIKVQVRSKTKGFDMWGELQSIALEIR